MIAVTGATVSATGNAVVEKFFNDALGNRDSLQQTNIRPSTHPDQNGKRHSAYDSYKRLTNVFSPSAPGWWYNKDLVYDGSGNQLYYALLEADAGSNSLFDVGYSFYDMGDRLAAYTAASAGGVADGAR